MKAQSPNHWTTREFPGIFILENLSLSPSPLTLTRKEKSHSKSHHGKAGESRTLRANATLLSLLSILAKQERNEYPSVLIAEGIAGRRLREKFRSGSLLSTHLQPQ